jgi:hypothetical protein
MCDASIMGEYSVSKFLENLEQTITNVRKGYCSVRNAAKRLDMSIDDVQLIAFGKIIL